MPILKNQRHELFAQELAKGAPANAAYIAAGYTPSDQNAQRLTRNDKVKARVAELQARGAERTKITIALVLEELARIALADVTEAVEWGEAIPTMIPDMDECVFVQDVRMKPSDQLPPHARAAISEVRKTKEGIAVKFHSKTAALQMLGQHLGMFKDKVEVSGKLTLEQLVMASYRLREEREQAEATSRPSPRS